MTEENTIEPRFSIESCVDNYVRITIVCQRPPGANTMPDQESRGAMAVPRAIWFMVSTVRGFALQYKRPMVARALESLEKAAQQNFDAELKKKAAYDQARGTDV